MLEFYSSSEEDLLLPRAGVLAVLMIGCFFESCVCFAILWGVRIQ